MTQFLFKSLICVIKIWDWYLWWFVNNALFSNVAISVTFSSFSIIIFDWKGIFWILMVSSERSSSDLSEYTVCQIKKYSIHSIHLKSILGEKKKKIGYFLHFFFRNTSKSSDFKNSVDYIGKNTSKSFRLQPLYIQK